MYINIIMEKINKSPKYYKILKTSKELFWKFGIKRVTIEEICREAGVSKMTFYRFFPNKAELAKNMIDNLFNEGLDKYNEIMSQDIPFAEKIKKQLLMKFENTDQISPEIINDIYTDETYGFRDYWEKRRKEILERVVSDYKIAQKKGWIRKDIKLEFIIYINNKLNEIVSDKELQSIYNNMQELIMEVANLFFYGILNKSETNEE